MRFFVRFKECIVGCRILMVLSLVIASNVSPSMGVASESGSCEELCRILMDQLKSQRGQGEHSANLQDSVLTARQLLDHAANRFGYGLSSNEKLVSEQEVKRALIIASNTILYDANKSHPFYNDTLAQMAKAFDEVIELRDLVPNETSITYNPVLDSVQELKRKFQLIRKIAAAQNDDKVKIRLSQRANKINSSARNDVAQFRILISAFQSEYYEPQAPMTPRDKHSNLSSILEEFWFNHFNVDYQKIGLNAALGNNGYEVMIHNKMNTTFYELLQGVINHVAMLTYLDNDGNSYNFKSNKPSNQNLGRELLELHTLGEGADGPNKLYGQSDVAESAKMLTGLNVVTAGEPDDPDGFFYGTRIRPTLHVPDFNGDINTAPLIMKKRFCLHASKVIDDPDGNQKCDLPLSKKPPVTAEMVTKHLNLYLNFLANHSQTKKNICNKLAARFVARKWLPISRRCQAAWGDGGDLKAMYRAIIWSPEVWSSDNYLNSEKNPNELAISALRASGLTAKALISEGETWQSTVKALSSKMFDEIEFLGLAYRNWMTPTGYPQGGWESKGLLVRWTKSSFNLANLMESLGGNRSAPIMGLVVGQGIAGSLEEHARSLETGSERLLLVQKALGFASADGYDVVRDLSPEAKGFATQYLSPMEGEPFLSQQWIGDTLYKVPVKSGLIIETASGPFLKK